MADFGFSSLTINDVIRDSERRHRDTPALAHQRYSSHHHHHHFHHHHHHHERHSETREEAEDRHRREAEECDVPFKLYEKIRVGHCLGCFRFGWRWVARTNVVGSLFCIPPLLPFSFFLESRNFLLVVGEC